MSEPGRVAAVDYGRRRIGLAVSDALRITTRGLPTLDRSAGAAGPQGLEEAAAQVAAVLLGEQAREVVLGLPLHADGRESEMSAEVRRFAALLEARLAPAGVRLHLHDEGLSSWEAEEGLKAGGRDLARARREGAIDQRAALGLLRGWLEGQA
ncbi:MAG: Holliday junction resolvase RuvX [Planctomycetia bacterium]